MARKQQTPHVISVLFKDGTIRYLKGHHTEGLSGPTCGFTANPTEAIQSHYPDNLAGPWLFLLREHHRETGEIKQAVIHKITEDPKFKVGAA